MSGSPQASVFLQDVERTFAGGLKDVGCLGINDCITSFMMKHGINIINDYQRIRKCKVHLIYGSCQMDYILNITLTLTVEDEVVQAPEATWLNTLSEFFSSASAAWNALVHNWLQDEDGHKMCKALLKSSGAIIQSSDIIRLYQDVVTHMENRIRYLHFSISRSPSQAMKCMPGIRRCFVNSADDINAETPR